MRAAIEADGKEHHSSGNTASLNLDLEAPWTWAVASRNGIPTPLALDG